MQALNVSIARRAIRDSNMFVSPVCKQNVYKAYGFSHRQDVQNIQICIPMIDYLESISDIRVSTIVIFDFQKPLKPL